MSIHELKVDPIPFEDVLAGRKTAEVRRNDRGFEIGDLLHLRETTSPRFENGGANFEYTGRELSRRITHIQRGYGLPAGVVVLSMAEAERTPAPAAQQAQGEARDAARMRKLCELLDAMDDLGNGFPSPVHEAFQNGGAATRTALDVLIADAPAPSASPAAYDASQHSNECIDGDCKGCIASPADQSAQDRNMVESAALTDEQIWKKWLENTIGKSLHEEVIAFARALLVQPQPSRAVGVADAQPVAWMASDGRVSVDGMKRSVKPPAWQREEFCIHLYAAPQSQAQGSAEDALEKLRQWADAYPLDLFPEPDFVRAYQVLRDAGMSLDAISAANMRHVITGVRRIIDAATQQHNGKEGNRD